PRLDRRAARAALGLERDRPLWVLGSVRPGEARLLARAWAALPAAERARWQVVAVPRHARATAELIDEARRHGVAETTNGPANGAWRWDDRSGVLNDYYAAADLAFVGGSLMPLGGHNPAEPAATGAAVLMGAHHAAQAEAVRGLETCDGITIVGS